MFGTIFTEAQTLPLSDKGPVDFFYTVNLCFNKILVIASLVATAVELRVQCSCAEKIIEGPKVI